METSTEGGEAAETLTGHAATHAWSVALAETMSLLSKTTKYTHQKQWCVHVIERQRTLRTFWARLSISSALGHFDRHQSGDVCYSPVFTVGVLYKI